MKGLGVAGMVLGIVGATVSVVAIVLGAVSMGRKETKNLKKS